MGIFSYFFGKKRKNNYEFTAEDSATGVSQRKFKAEIREMKNQIEKLKMERQLLEEKDKYDLLRESIYGSREEIEETADSPEKMLMNMMMMRFMSQNQPQAEQNPPANSGFSTQNPYSSTKRRYENDDLYILKDGLPKSIIKKARKLPEDQLKEIIRSKLPDADEDSVERAAKIILEK